MVGSVERAGRRGGAIRRLRAAAVRSLGALAVALAAYLAVLCLPEPWFAYKAEHGPFRVWSDRPIDPAIGRVLDEAHARIARSELYSSDQRFKIFLCNDEWRLALFSKRFAGRMGGLSDNELIQAVYLRQSDVAMNRLVPPGGWTASMSDRPLSYFLAHELTHTMQARRYGRLLAFRYPFWLVEGYADHVARGPLSDAEFTAELARLRAGDRVMDHKRSGLYRGFRLQVAWLLERRGRSLDALMRDPPDEAAVTRELRAFDPR